MAKKVTVSLLDDTNGRVAEETVEFNLDGGFYEIDLTAKNAKKIRADYGEWIPHARVIAGRRRGDTKAKTMQQERNLKIRTWLRRKGIEVSDRGRIPADYVKMYDRAHSNQ
ncbi:histone-like nucleoid-structuring protein Lsr2 [Mycobacteroides abscessus]